MAKFGVSEPIAFVEYDEETNTYKNGKKLEDIMAEPRPKRTRVEVKTEPRPKRTRVEVKTSLVMDLDCVKYPAEFQKDLAKLHKTLAKILEKHC